MKFVEGMKQFKLIIPFLLLSEIDGMKEITAVLLAVSKNFTIHLDVYELLCFKLLLTQKFFAFLHSCDLDSKSQACKKAKNFCVDRHMCDAVLVLPPCLARALQG